MKHKMSLLLCLILILNLVGCTSNNTVAVPTQTSTPTSEATAVPTAEPTLTPTEAVTNTPAITPTATATSTPAVTPEEQATVSPEPTAAEQATASPEPTAAEQATTSPEPTEPEESTATPVPTTGPGATASPTPTEPQATATPQPTNTPKPTTAVQPTATPKPTSTPKPTATPTLKPTATPQPTKPLSNYVVPTGLSAAEVAAACSALPKDGYGNEVERAVQIIVKNLIKPGMAEFEKAQAIHDYIVRYTSYDYTNYQNHTIPDSSYFPYGCLILHVCVCDGYARSYKLLMDAIGIDCVKISGKADNGNGYPQQGTNHAWNQVKIDGEWYYVDTTWDDPLYTNEFGEEVEYENVVYSYFLIPEEKMRKDHIDVYAETGEIHKCTSNRFEEYYEKLSLKNNYPGIVICDSKEEAFNTMKEKAGKEENFIISWHQMGEYAGVTNEFFDYVTKEFYDYLNTAFYDSRMVMDYRGTGTEGYVVLRFSDFVTYEEKKQKEFGNSVEVESYSDALAYIKTALEEKKATIEVLWKGSYDGWLPTEINDLVRDFYYAFLSEKRTFADASNTYTNIRLYDFKTYEAAVREGVPDVIMTASYEEAAETILKKLAEKVKTINVAAPATERMDFPEIGNFLKQNYYSSNYSVLRYSNNKGNGYYVYNYTDLVSFEEHFAKEYPGVKVYTSFEEAYKDFQKAVANKEKEISFIMPNCEYTGENNSALTKTIEEIYYLCEVNREYIGDYQLGYIYLTYNTFVGYEEYIESEYPGAEYVEKTDMVEAYVQKKIAEGKTTIAFYMPRNSGAYFVIMNTVEPNLISEKHLYIDNIKTDFLKEKYDIHVIKLITEAEMREKAESKIKEENPGIAYAGDYETLKAVLLAQQAEGKTEFYFYTDTSMQSEITSAIKELGLDGYDFSGWVREMFTAYVIKIFA